MTGYANVFSLEDQKKTVSKKKQKIFLRFFSLHIPYLILPFIIGSLNKVIAVQTFNDMFYISLLNKSKTQK